MDADRWRRAESLFLEALEMGPEGRRARLESIASTDPALADTVRRMLAADTKSDSVLDQDVASLADLLASDETTPKTLGRYEVLSPLGRGGMSTVFRARRADGSFEREVALKVVRAGFDPTRSLRRFHAEAQVLARLEHPNIARLYDAGLEGDLAYLAMERVEGRRIDVYCDERAPGLEARLLAFLDVCRAVAYAHQNLVVHRDLKPSNILVTDAGEVKLLDFGISSLLNREGDHDRAEPETRFRAMTVEYASPEQIQGLPVSTASDVYSLGVVLYELLTGRRPHADEDTTFEKVRAVVEDAVPRPSTVAAQLRGDLDTILLKALEKDPSRRYGSVEALMDDLRRHLDGLPVRARPATLRYRTGKFVRRNVVGVAAAALVGLSLIAGLGASLWQAGVAAEQRDLARLEADKATRVTDFLIDVFRVADPTEARADTLTASQILDRGAARLETALASEPLIQATMFDVVGRVYGSLSLYEQADSLLRRGLDLRSQLLDTAHPDIAASLQNVANVAMQYDTRVADSLFARAAEIRAETLGPDHPLVGASLVGRAYALLGRDNEAAERYLDRADAIYAAQSEEQSLNQAQAIYARGFLRHSQARYGEAESLYRAALAIRIAEQGANHPETLTVLANLGSLMRLLGRYAAADSALRAVHAARLQVFGPRHLRVANSLTGLSELAYDRGDYEESEALAREALDLKSGLLGSDHQEVTTVQFFLARVLQARGDLAGATTVYRSILDRAESRGQSAGLARLLNGFAVNLEARGDWEGAETFYRRSWEVYRAASGEDHPFTAIVQGNVGAALIERGDLSGARDLLRSALGILQDSYGDSHSTVGVVRLQLGTIDLLEGRPEAAEAELGAALDVLQGALPADHWRIGQARLRLAAALADRGRLDEARTLLESSREVLEPHRLARYGDWRQLLSELYEVALAQGRTDEAEHLRDEFRATEALLPSR